MLFRSGNFIVPALIQRGGITLAISTGGASPAFAKRLRLDLERFLGRKYPALLKEMAKQRRGGGTAPYREGRSGGLSRVAKTNNHE